MRCWTKLMILSEDVGGIYLHYGEINNIGINLVKINFNLTFKLQLTSFLIYQFALF